MKFGLTNSELATITSVLSEPLKSQGALIWIFRSRARGDHKTFSDLDIPFELPAKKDPTIWPFERN